MIWHDLAVTIQRTSRRKTMCIVVERDGSISVKVPTDIPDEKVKAILDQKEYDVFKKYTLWQEANNEHIVRQYVSGQSFMYLGRNYSLSIVDGQKRHLIFRNGTFFLSSQATTPREDFIRFYKRQAKIKILERVEYLRSRLAVTPQKIQIKEMPTRWGSCTPSRNVYFNWRCIMFPVFVIDYIIVHEFTHLMFADHSRDFWQKISEVLPDYNYTKDWLTVNGVRADI